MIIIVDISTVVLCSWGVNSTSDQPGPRYQPLLQLLKTSEAVWHASRLFFARWDLSPSQFNILNILRDRPEGVSQTELSVALITHRSNVTGLVDRLEKRGLVRREEAPGDRRAYRVVLTASGMKLSGEILPQYYAIAERVWGDVPKAKARELEQTLLKVGENALEIAGTEQPSSIHET